MRALSSFVSILQFVFFFAFCGFQVGCLRACFGRGRFFAGLGFFFLFLGGGGGCVGRDFGVYAVGVRLEFKDVT